MQLYALRPCMCCLLVCVAWQMKHGVGCKPSCEFPARAIAAYDTEAGCGSLHGWAFVLSDADALRGARARARATVRVWGFTVKSTAERCRAAWLAGAVRRQQHGPAQRPWLGNAAR